MYIGIGVYFKFSFFYDVFDNVRIEILFFFVYKFFVFSNCRILFYFLKFDNYKFYKFKYFF